MNDFLPRGVGGMRMQRPASERARAKGCYSLFIGCAAPSFSSVYIVLVPLCNTAYVDVHTKGTERGKNSKKQKRGVKKREI